MSLLTTLDSGQYCPPLYIRAGVYPCTQYLTPPSGDNINASFTSSDSLSVDYYNAYSAKRNSSRINGVYTLADKFEGGYFNFEDWRVKDFYSLNNVASGTQIYTAEQPNVLHYDYWGNSNAVADTIFGNPVNKNICAGVAIKGLNGGIERTMELYTPGINGVSASGCTFYGRFRLGGTTNLGHWGRLVQVGPDNNCAVLSVAPATITKPHWDFIVNGEIRGSVEPPFSLVNNGEFFHFLNSYDATTGYTFCYGGFDESPLRLLGVLNIGTDFRGSIYGGTTAFYDEYDGVHATQGKIWTDFGTSNRAWSAEEISKFIRHLYRPQTFLEQNLISNPPPPSGFDTDYLNFHFPANSANSFRSSCNQGAVGLIQYYVPLASGLGDQFYEFDRSQFNATALALDMWVQNSGTNPSGYLGAMIDFNQDWDGLSTPTPVVKNYWSGFPILIQNNRPPDLVRMSGLFYNSSNGPSDLIEVTREYADNAVLKFGAWTPYTGNQDSSDIKIYSARVKLDSWCTPPNTGNSLPLYTSGQVLALNHLDLYLQQSTAFNGLDLYIKGAGSTNSGCTLFIAGQYSFGSIPLYIGGKDSTNSGIPLTITGGVEKANMPLYINSAPPSQMSGSVPLFMWATTHSGISQGMTLFVGENAPSGVKSAGMNLYINGPNSQKVTAGMPLFIKKDIDTEHGSVSLYCQNSNTLQSGSLTLFLQTQSGTLGAVPVSGAMNLFIARSSEAAAHNFTLYTSGPNSANNNLSMYINGGTPYFSSIPLTINGKGVTTSNPLKFFTSGF